MTMSWSTTALVGVTYQTARLALCTIDVAAGKIATESSGLNPANNAVDATTAPTALATIPSVAHGGLGAELFDRFRELGTGSIASAANFNVILRHQQLEPGNFTNYAINCGGGAVGPEAPTPCLGRLT
jgi:hypothetical protein